MNQQIRYLGLGLMICFTALFIQLNRIQLIQQDELQSNPSNTRDFVRDFSRERGSIFTADGTVIANSIEVDDLLERERLYPEGDLYAHTVGFFSFRLGADGLERTYNDQLAGQTGAQRYGSLNDLFTNTDTTANLTVTLRHDVQTVARDALGARRGSVVALDPRSGAVLAFWSNPSYDPGILGSIDLEGAQQYWDGMEELSNFDDPRLPRMYRELFFPGSTFKVVTAAAGLESGAVTLAAPEFEPADEYIAPLTTVPLANFAGSTCGGTMLDAIVASCNTVFARMAAEFIGAGPLIEAADSFGFNHEPPIDLPLPEASNFPTDFGAQVSETEGDHPIPILENTPALAQAGIGQFDVKATPLQMALVASAIAREGVIMKPHVLSELRDQDGDLIEEYTPAVWRLALSAGDAADLEAAMIEVARRGTARGLAISGMVVGGKTGTAQVDAERPDDTHAWIIGFAGPPGEEPTVAVAVLVESIPGLGQQTGGVDAAPIARAVLEAVLTAQGHL
jgi:penicillin-binding protein A